MDCETRRQDEILAILDSRGVKQTWLARETKIEATQLNHILQGRRRPPLDFHRKVARALRVRVADVIPADVRPAPDEVAA